MVAGMFILVMLVRYARIENVRYILMHQPGNMTVNKLCRIAFGFAGDGFNTQLVNFTCGCRGKNHLIPKLSKEREPEWIVFVHVEYAGNTDLTSGRFVFGQRLIIEGGFQFIVEKIRNLVLVLFFADTALTTVAGYKLATAGETVNGQKTGVGTALTACHGGFKLEFADILWREQSGHNALVMLACNQGSTEGAHDAGNVRTDSLAAADSLKAAKNGIVIEGAALNNDVFAEILRVGNLDNFIKRIFDNGISKTGGNIGNGSAFLLSLFNLGIHKYGTTGTEVNRILGVESNFGEILYLIA